MATSEPPTRMQLIDWLAPRHDEAVALHGRGLLVDLVPGRYLARAEGRYDPRPGRWFLGPFLDRAHAVRYSEYLAGLGRRGLRRELALPRIWEDGGQGNQVDVIRLYTVVHPTPAISSVVAPQREGGTVMARPEHRAAVMAGNVMQSAEYPGQAQQLLLPVVEASLHGTVDLVARVPGAVISVNPA